MSPALWPVGTVVLHARNLEGALLVPATISAGGRDTSGSLVLDTGAGYLALDRGLAAVLGIGDHTGDSEVVVLADRPVAQLVLGELRLEQVEPVLIVDASIVRRAIDRPVLGLLGQSVLAPRIVVIDYSRGEVVLIPADSSRTWQHDSADTLGNLRVAAPAAARIPSFSRRARAVPFRLAGDGKILVAAFPTAAPGGRAFTLVLDTGATKCVLFERALNAMAPDWRRWPAVRGLSAPTLFGDAEARMVRMPGLRIGTGAAAAAASQVDGAVIGGALEAVLTQAVGEPVHGLLGYSFLRHFRVAIDYPGRMLWLEPRPVGRDMRPFEYSHVGIQLERRGDAVRVAAVAEDSPAARAGIVRGDELVRIAGASAASQNVLALSRRLEGPPGSSIQLTFRHGGHEHTCRLVRKRLL